MVKGPTAKSILRHELLGLRVRAEPRGGGMVHEGEVVGETRNMLRILRDDGRIIMLPKNSYTFIFTLPRGEKVKVEGWAIIGRPEERLKKRYRRW